MKKIIVASALSVLFGLSTSHGSDGLQREMKKHLNSVADTFRLQYAPKEWKREFAGWDLEKVVTNAEAEIDQIENITIKDYHQILAKFFNSTKDYHVGFSFERTESAALHFNVRGNGERVFIVHINRKRLSTASFPFQVGDEIISFDGKPVNEVLDELQAALGGNTKETDRAIAELQLTRRRASRGQIVPKDSVVLGIKKKGSEQVQLHQMAWDYQPEKIDYTSVENFLRGNEQQKKGFQFERFPLEKKKSFLTHIESMNMISPLARSMTSPEANPHQIGGRKSFLPALGKKVFETKEDNPFHAYIALGKKRELIGYVRIASYSIPDADKFVNAFADIMKKMEELADVLVIDQVNNPGGSVFYLYTLASMLTDQPLKSPRHHMTILPGDLSEALTELPKLEKITTDEEAIAYVGAKTASGFPVNLQMTQFAENYYRFIVDQFELGNFLTEPFYIWGADQLNPSQRAKFTKPILVLVNELDFSGGDFFPAILQDNKRATIMGTRTAGAGGYVLSHEPLNFMGLKDFSLTGSLARRVSNNPIENLGVVPDLNYTISAEDYQQGFKAYHKTVLEKANSLIKK